MPKVSSRVRNPRAGRKTSRGLGSDAPLRAELFNLEQLKQHAQAIAAAHQVISGGGANRLLKRLEHNEKVLRDFNRATLAVNQSRRITPAAEWLLDNFYLIEEQIQLARRHLPSGYSRELPRLATGPFAGWLRVYVLVLELISHVDAQIDLELLAAFVESYQKVVPLTLGELWAVPIMLRLGLIECLARVTTGLTTARRQRDVAHEWVLRLHKIAEITPSRLVIVVAEMAKANPPSTSSFVSEFCARLSLTTVELHQAWMKRNNINLREFCKLMLEEGRIRKLHKALSVGASFRRNTQRLFDYLRVSDSYTYWAGEAARHEERIRKRGDETILVDLEANPHALMMEHLARTGLSIAGSLENYVQEAGFGTIPELTVALERDSLGAQQQQQQEEAK